MARVGRRSYGTGSLFTRTDRNGRETWYGQFRDRGRLVKRRLGPKRAARECDGLTKAEAEGALRRLMAEYAAEPAVEQVDVAEAGRRWLEHLATIGRKKSTLVD